MCSTVTTFILMLMVIVGHSLCGLLFLCLCSDVPRSAIKRSQIIFSVITWNGNRGKGNKCSFAALFFNVPKIKGDSFLLLFRGIAAARIGEKQEQTEFVRINFEKKVPL
jgi:hypothetical protein